MSTSSNTSGGITLDQPVKAADFVEEPVSLELTEALAQHIGGEVFLFSCPIIKYNQYGWRNKRTFCLTQQSFLLLKNKCKDLRRTVPLASLLGVTVSYHAESSEFVVHIK